MTNVVVVESPAKAKTINKYLGPGYKVLASYGHVRDLPSKDGSVRPDADFAMDWEVDPKARKHIQEIARALKGAEHLYLATDPDREGEAISWHVREILDERAALAGVDVKRVVFNEVTRNAVLEAIAHPREINRELVGSCVLAISIARAVCFAVRSLEWDSRIIAISVPEIPRVVRLVRAVVLTIREMPYVEAAVASGATWVGPPARRRGPKRDSSASARPRTPASRVGRT